MPRDQSEILLASDPGLGDCWFAYLALAPDSVIDYQVEGEPDHPSHLAMIVTRSQTP